MYCAAILGCNLVLIPTILIAVIFLDSFQLLQEIHEHYTSVHSRDDFYCLSFWVPGLHDYFQMVSFWCPLIPECTKHPHPLHQYVSVQLQWHFKCSIISTSGMDQSTVAGFGFAVGGMESGHRDGEQAQKFNHNCQSCERSLFLWCLWWPCRQVGQWNYQSVMQRKPHS